MKTCAVFLLLCCALPLLATEFRSGEMVVIPPEQTIDDDLVVSGWTVEIRGHVTGDVVAAGDIVRVGGTVDGDVIAAGRQVVVGGPIGGSLYAAGQDVAVNAKVARNLMVAGAVTLLHPGASIGRDAAVAGAWVEVQSEIGRNLRACADNLVLAQGAVIGGDFIAQANQHEITPGAIIKGQRTITAPQRPRSGPWKLFFAVALFIAGALLLAFAPRLTRETEMTLRSRPGASLLTGLILTLLSLPLFALLLLVFPLAILWLWVFLTALFISPLFIALTAGQLLLRKPDGNPYVALLLGVALLALVALIPVLGVLVIIAAILFGLGAFAQTVYGRRHSSMTESPTPPAPEPA